MDGKSNLAGFHHFSPFHDLIARLEEKLYDSEHEQGLVSPSRLKERLGLKEHA